MYTNIYKLNYNYSDPRNTIVLYPSNLIHLFPSENQYTTPIPCIWLTLLSYQAIHQQDEQLNRHDTYLKQ